MTWMIIKNNNRKNGGLMWQTKTNFLSHLDPALSKASRFRLNGPLPDEVPVEEPQRDPEPPYIEAPGRALGPPPTPESTAVEVP
jgi:hypothetical protein